MCERFWTLPLAVLVQEAFKRDPHGGDLYVFRGKSGKLIKILWHDGLGMSLYAKRLERGRFLWPSSAGGVVTITPAHWLPARLGLPTCWRACRITPPSTFTNSCLGIGALRTSLTPPKRSQLFAQNDLTRVS